MATATNGSPISGGFRDRFRDSFRRSIRRIRGPYERDPKKIGILGAPQCRCTPLVLALCVALTGLVVVGVGACMAAFMWHDETPKSLGLALVGLGAAMIAAGFGLFIYDSRVRSLMPPAAAEVTYASPQQGATHSTHANLSAATVGNGHGLGTITNVHTMPSNAGHMRRMQDPAPPPYDAVLEEDNHRYGNVGPSQQRPTSQARGTAREKRNIASSDV